MTDFLGGRNPYLRNSVGLIAIAVVFYLVVDDPSLALSILLAAGILFGAIGVVAGDPTRWSVPITLRVYQAVPILFGVVTVAVGSYYLLTTDLWIPATVLISWGVLSFVGVSLANWEEVAAHLERLNDTETDTEVARLPLPRRQFLQLQYVGKGILTVGFAVVLARLLYRPDLGVYAALAGIGWAGLLHVGCSPYSGPPERVVRLRQARWAALGAGLGTSSLWGLLVADATAASIVLGVVTLGLAYWAVVVVSWEEVRESIAVEQTDSGNVDD